MWILMFVSNGFTIEVLYSLVSMGRVPFKSAKEGGGHSFKCCHRV